MAESLIKIVKEPGVVDLPTAKVRMFFAKALKLERETGETTPEALEFLELAIAAMSEE